MRAVLLVTVLVGMHAFASAQSPAPERISSRRAYEQVINRAIAVLPAASREYAGGLVVSDVTISATGKVTAVRVIDGHKALHEAARENLRRWRFSPFIIRGEARPVVVVVGLAFPRPTGEEYQRLQESARSARVLCERELERDPAAAVPLCEAAVEAGSRLPHVAVSSMNPAGAELARRAYMAALLGTQRTSEALAILNELIARREAVPDMGPVLAGDYSALALLHQRRGAHDAAERAFAKADAAYESLYADVPTATYGNLLRQALRQHASYRRSRGDAAGATRLDARAAAVVIPDEGPRPADLRRFRRQVDDLTIVEWTNARLDDADIRQIRSTMAPARLWWINVSTGLELEGRPRLLASVCHQPDRVSGSLRRGRCTPLTKTSAGWERTRRDLEYVQLVLTADDAVIHPPASLEVSDMPRRPSDETVLSLLTMIRRSAVATPTTRLRSDIQPWPPSRIWFMAAGRALVTLRSHDGRSAQMIELREVAAGWEVVEMR